MRQALRYFILATNEAGRYHGTVEFSPLVKAFASGIASLNAEMPYEALCLSVKAHRIVFLSP
jgi:hypothetical protein